MVMRGTRNCLLDKCHVLSRRYIYHSITASSIVWLQEPLSILQLSNQRCWVDARIGCLGSTEDLPAHHSKWQLHKMSVLQSTISIIQPSKLWSTDKPNHSRVIRSWTYHICFLWKYSISQTAIHFTGSLTPAVCSCRMYSAPEQESQL